MNKKKYAEYMQELVKEGKQETMDAFVQPKETLRGGTERRSVLLKSGAGTGKTTKMIKGIVDLLEEGVKPSDIVFIATSRASCDDARTKLEKALSKKMPEKNAAEVIADLRFNTFYSYALNLKREMGIEANAITQDNRRSIILDGLRQNNPKGYSDKYLIDQVGYFDDAISYLKGFGLAPASIDFERSKQELKAACKARGYDEARTANNLTFFDTFMKTFEYYEKRKKEEGLADYNDILMLIMKGLDEGKKPQNKHIFVDGIQNMNKLESLVIDKTGVRKHLALDRKKAIFGFRGAVEGENASITSSKEGMVEGGDDKVNKRNPLEISKYAEGIFLRWVSNKKEYEADFADLINEKKEKGVVELYVSDDPVGAAAEIIKKKYDERGEDADLLVLARTNKQLYELIGKLELLGIKWSGDIKVSRDKEEHAKKDLLDYLEGLLYSEEYNKVKMALFSPFSGKALKEAYEINESYKEKRIDLKEVESKAFEEVKKAVPSLFEGKPTRADIDKIFEKWIIPKSLSLSQEHYLTAIAVYKGLVSEIYADKPKSEDRKTLLDYLRTIGGRNNIHAGSSGGVRLGTVHKNADVHAKTVVYLPAEYGGGQSYLDNAKYAIMKSMANIDIVEKSKDEPAMIDYVATTRAENELHIVVPPKLERRYDIGGIVKNQVKPKAIAEILPLHAAFRSSETMDDYRKIIYDHFKKNEHLSYTRVTVARDPYNYFIKCILGVEEKSDSMIAGSQVHEMAEKFFGGKLDESSLNETERKYFGNIKEVRDRLDVAFKAKQVDAEYEFNVDVSEIFPKLKNGTVFTGKIDAVFEVETPGGKKKYVLVDYKTDKDKKWLGAHLGQVATYRKAYAAEKGIKEEDIEVVVAYINNINGSSHGIDLYSTMPALGKTVSQEQLSSRLKEVEQDTQKMLEYRADPEKFVQALLQTPKSQRDVRFDMIERALLGNQRAALKDIERK